MVHYFCGHPSHEDKRVDLTTLVRAERGYGPEFVFLAALPELTARILALPNQIDRTPEFITELLVGRRSVAPDQRVVLLPDPADQIEPYGLYPLDALSGVVTIQALARLQQREHPRVIDLSEMSYQIRAPDDRAIELLNERLSSPRHDPQSRLMACVLPPVGEGSYGIFSVQQLAKALADKNTEAELRRAVEDLPEEPDKPVIEPKPWRVLIDCPVPEGTPQVGHKVTFAGPAGEQPAEFLGLPASGRDIQLEKAVEDDLTPRKSVERMETQLKFVLAGQALITGLLAGLGWLTGNLATAVRDAPILFGLAMALTAFAFVVAVLGLVAAARREGNLNDLDQVRTIYNERKRLMWEAVLWSTILYALAIVAAAAFPVYVALQGDPSGSQPIAISFDSSAAPTTATFSATHDGLRTGDTRHLAVTAFRDGDVESEAGTILFEETSTADTSGKVAFTAKLAIPAGYTFVAAQVLDPSDPALENAAQCVPPDQVPAGCAIARIPAGPVAAKELLPAPSLSLESADGVVFAVAAETTVTGLRADQSVTLRILSYSGPDDPEQLLQQTTSADSTGTASLKSKVFLPAGAQWVTAQLSTDTASTCSPQTDNVPSGCALVRVI